MVMKKREHLSTFIKPGVDSACNYYKRTDLTRAYIIGMCKYITRLFESYPLIYSYFSVVNPSVRMSWIMNNWEKKWRDNAVDIVQKLVSILTFERYYYLLIPFLRWRNTGRTSPPQRQPQDFIILQWIPISWPWLTSSVTWQMESKLLTEILAKRACSRNILPMSWMRCLTSTHWDFGG